MNSEFQKCLEVLESAHNQLACKVQPPRKVLADVSYTYRFAEKSLDQALVQLLARTITGLRSADLLLHSGFLQEQAIVQRTLHEIEENIFLLAVGTIQGSVGDVHHQFLREFYSEAPISPFSDPDAPKSKRVLRPAVRDWIAAVEGSSEATPAMSNAPRQLYEIGSGYVHARSPQIMDLYAGNPPRWQLQGNFDETLHADHTEGSWNYFYRAILSFSFSARAMGESELGERLSSFGRDFAASAGKDYSVPP